MIVHCSTHPQATALYRCDGCQRLLCEDCCEQGHRLVFCRHCRERGVSLDPSVPNEKAREAKIAREAPYSLLDALAYPFRGPGAYLFWSMLAMLGVFAVARQIPGLAILALVGGFLLGLVVLWTLPATLFAIIRTTYKGENELPDWPEFGELSERTSEVIGFLLCGLIALLPGSTIAVLVGCPPVEWALGTAGPACWLLLLVHMVVTVVLWIPALGAVGVFGENSLAFRFDQHLRAIREMGDEFWRVAAAIIALLIFGQAVSFAILFRVPFLGSVISVMTGLYTWFTASHLVGVLFREHHDLAERVYWSR